jgi:hypothetical protein
MGTASPTNVVAKGISHGGDLLRHPRHKLGAIASTDVEALV